MPGHTNKPTEVWVEEDYTSVIAQTDGTVELRTYDHGHLENVVYINPAAFKDAVAEAFRRALLGGGTDA